MLGLLLGVGLLSTSCGLPTDDDVRRAGQVQPDAAERRGSPRELPPGPQPGARPEDIVSGFLEAQISGEDDHAVSRSYLLRDTEWADDAGVTVYDPGTRQLTVDPTGPGPLTYEVSFDEVGAVGPDGAGTVRTPVPRTETFGLARDEAGEWRIDALPAGLLLSTETRDAAFTAFTVFFLQAVSGGPTPHLVADRQLLPFGSGADQLVRRVLAPPSSGLADSGRTAAPPGVGLVSPVTLDPAGAEAEVDLTAEAAELLPSDRDALAAQLVWTLRQVPDLLRLRLLVEGEPLLPGGRRTLDVREAYPGADPQGDEQLAVASAVTGGRLRPVGAGSLAPSVRSATSAIDLAVDPRSGQVALLSGPPDEPSLRVGSRDGPLRPVTSGPGLASPTWGDGSYGVWLLRTGTRPAVLVSRNGTLSRVGFPGLPALDATATLRVSRDGSRVLLVSDGQLFLARVVPPDATVDPADRVPVLTDVRQLRVGGTVAADWLDPTTLAVLVSETRPLLLVSVDGLSQQAVNQPIQEVRARSVAAQGDRPLLVGAVVEELRDPSPVPSDGPEPPGEPGSTGNEAPTADPTSTAEPETRLYTGRPDQPFDPVPLQGALRPRYPG